MYWQWHSNICKADLCPLLAVCAGVKCSLTRQGPLGTLSTTGHVVRPAVLM